MRMQLAGLAGLGGESTTFLPNVDQTACMAAGGLWVPYRTPNDSCVLPAGAGGGTGVEGSDTTTPSSPSAPPPPGCGENPCTWWDQVWVRDGCLNYLRCANPTSPLVISQDQGFFSGAGAAIGQSAGSLAGSTFRNLFVNPDGTSNISSLLLIGGLGVVALLIFSKRG